MQNQHQSHQIPHLHDCLLFYLLLYIEESLQPIEPKSCHHQQQQQKKKKKKVNK